MDSYLAISMVANDPDMTERLRAAVTQQVTLGTVPRMASSNPVTWVTVNRYLWASSPGWGEKWDYALLSHESDPEYKPGRDPAVITDADILAAVQAIGAPT